MKRYLIALLLPACLVGCAGPDEAQTTKPAIPENTSLTSHTWRLEDARNAQGMRISPLFAQTDRPVQINFNDNRFNVSNTCNNMGGTYSLHENRMTFGAMTSTKKMCADSRIAALDHEVSHRLSGISTYRITPATPPTLTLTASDGDILMFSGGQTPATRYGTEGETIFLEVAPQTIPCSPSLAPGGQCLQIRQIHYDSKGLKTGTPEQWLPFYQHIEGHNFQLGIQQILRVKRYRIMNAPADASDTAYVLDMVIESQIIRPKKRARTPR